MKQIYGLIGYPLGHSFSARYFNNKFSRMTIDAEYRLLPIESIDMLPDVISSNPDLCGLNVTIPYKERVIPFLADLSEEAREIAAVNTILITQSSDGNQSPLLKGFNTDAPGFQKAIDGFIPPEIKSALVLGTGGASKAVRFALRKKGFRVATVSRTQGKADLTYREIDESTLHNYPFIVNATPAGMFPDTEGRPDIPYHLLSRDNYCFDTVYNPEVTQFMKLSAGQGAHVKGGLEMLINQAEAAWLIWSATGADSSPQQN